MIPVNIITGVLGVGKTTAIRHLLAQRPKHETWAVVVNEFGALGIDGAVLDTAGGFAEKGVSGQSTTGGGDGGVVVREVAGGCLCCAVSAPFTVAVTQVLRRAKPHRLLIEPSGMGHPGGLFDALSTEFLKGALDLKATIALVDISLLNSENKKNELFNSEAFQDQVNCADVVVGTKADLATAEDVAQFTEWAQSLYPAKSKVAVVANGEVDLALLDTPCGLVCAPVGGAFELSQGGGGAFTSAHRKKAGALSKKTEPQPGASTPQNTIPAPTVGKPSQALGGTAEYKTAGLVFHRDEVFLRHSLKALFESLEKHPSVVRCKGVLRVGKEWVAPRFDGKRARESESSNQSSETKSGDDESHESGKSSVTLFPVAYRRDSRIEVIVKVVPPPSWDGSRLKAKGGALPEFDPLGLESLHLQTGTGEDAARNDAASDGKTLDEKIASAGHAAAAFDWVGLERAVRAALKPPRAS